MKLLIEERVFSWTDRFTVRNENGEARYYVEGELFSWGKKLHVYDLNNREVAYVEQKLLTFKPRYAVYTDGALIGEVVREFSFFRPRYTVEGADWDVEGEFWAHNFTVYHHGAPIARIDKEWFTWGDCYTLDIASDGDELQALALVLAIDCAMESDNHN